MKLLDECGLIGVSRSATDVYFDDFVKQIKSMTLRKIDDAHVYHSDISDREHVDVDVLFLDEVNAKKTDDPGMQIIMDGVTALQWKPLMANPAYKGRMYKPALWLSTANHEITQHEYCIPAVLRRTHYRYVVNSGRLYAQDCYRVKDATGNYKGGFETCQGRFGRWEEKITTISTTESAGPDNSSIVAVNKSFSNTTVARVEDTFSLESLVCGHCREVSFQDFMEFTLTKVLERLQTAMCTHEQTTPQKKKSVSGGSVDSAVDLKEI